MEDNPSSSQKKTDARAQSANPRFPLFLNLLYFNNLIRARAPLWEPLTLD
jgi:hypothetical protein